MTVPPDGVGGGSQSAGSPPGGGGGLGLHRTMVALKVQQFKYRPQKCSLPLKRLEMLNKPRMGEVVVEEVGWRSVRVRPLSTTHAQEQEEQMRQALVV